MDSADDAQANIERSARDVIRGYPLAAGLTSVADVINHLPVPQPSDPSLFAHPASLSLQAGPYEPLFDEYANEIAAILDQRPSNSALVEQWRQFEMSRAAEALHGPIRAFREMNAYADLNFAPPPFPINAPTSNIALPPPTSAATQLLDNLGFPYPPLPAQLTTTDSITNTASIPADQAASAAFFDQYLASQSQARATTFAASPHSSVRESSASPIKPSSIANVMSTPPRPTPISHPNRADVRAPASMMPPSSSPDPLYMSGGESSFNNGRHYDPSPQSSSPAGSPLKRQAYTLETSPKRSVPSNLTESQRAAASARYHEGDSTPSTTDLHDSGVESAVKRFKLETGGQFASSSNSTNGAKNPKHTMHPSEGQSMIDRISDFLSDLFSCDDSYVNDTSSSHVVNRGESDSKDPSKLFFDEEITTIDGLPLFNAATLRRLISQLSTVSSKGKGEELLEEIEEGGFARLLKIVERSWRGTEDLAFWPASATKERRGRGSNTIGKGKKCSKMSRANSDSPKKAGRRSRSNSRTVADDEEEEFDGDDEERPSQSRRSSRSRSRTPLMAMEVDVEANVVDAELAARDDDEMWSDDVLDSFEQSAHSLSNAVLAIRVALIVLTITTLPKSLYSVDYVLSMLTTLRHALDALVYPLVEAGNDTYLTELLSLRRDELNEVCESLSATLPLVTRLIQQEEMSEEIVISSVYLSLSPFFHEAAATTGKGKKVESNVAVLAMKLLRMMSLEMARALYARYPDQRSWIMEELLGNLTKLDASKKGKGAVRLRNGSSIHTISALILQLVQTCEPDLCAQVASRIADQFRLGDNPDRVLAEDDDELAIGAPEVFEGVVDPLDSALNDLIQPALDSATKSAWTVVSFLLQKSAKIGKAASGSTESEYRAVLENLIADLLATLNTPEWPASELMLTVCCKAMMNALADQKSTHEGNALKSLALDHLGSIGSRLTQNSKTISALPSLNQIVSQSDIKALDAFVQAQQDVLRHLIRTKESLAVVEYLGATFGADLISALNRSTSLLTHFTPAELERSEDGQKSQAFNARLRNLTESFWRLPLEDDVFGISTEDEQPRIDALTASLARGRPLTGFDDSILKLIVDSSESTAVSFRTKALRGIGLFVAQDPGLFHRAEVRKSIENRMHDNSPAVRDAAIELVGRYVVNRPDLATEYLPQISERITDTGLSVRKRVVKLLKSLYIVINDDEQKIEICRKLVWRAFDEDDGIKELAVEAIEDLWFNRIGRARSGSANDDSKPSTSGDTGGASSRTDQLAQIVMAVTGDGRERAPPVDELLRMIIAKHKEKGTSPPLDRLREVTENLIDSLLEDEGSRNIVACIKTVHVLSSVDPSLLSTSKAIILLPFLKSASSPQEQVVSDYLLKIFRTTVTLMPKTSSKFSRDLQSALMPMLNKPSSSPTTLQEVVACYCAVVRGQTHDFTAMINVFRVSVERLAGEVRKLMDPEKIKSVNTRTLPILCSLSALFCENANFDQLRTTYPDTKKIIDQITPRPVSEHVYNILVKLHQLQVNPATSSAALTSLGFVFRAYPTFMLSPPSTLIMDAIFDSNALQTQLQLLKIIQDFLGSQSRSTLAPSASASKKSSKASNGGVKMDELVGNVDGFADSGVASAISQRYINKILSATLSTNAQIQRVAVETLTAVARSGFSHPLTIAPHLVALTTSEDGQTASKAYATLSLLYQKHASLLSTRFVEPAKVAHGFAQTCIRAGEMLHGYSNDPPQSAFGRWYSLLQKEKRTIQLDYLKTLSRTLEVEPGASCSYEDVSLVRFIAEALSSLDYKRMEEPMSIISHLNSALAVAGLQVLHLLEVDLEGGAGLLSGTPTSSPVKAQEDSSKAPSRDLANQSIICGIALLLRDHLKKLYSITDAKLAKFVPGKKSAQGDRAVTRRADALLALGLDDYERMPFASHPMATVMDLKKQRSQYIDMIQDDGTIGALDEFEMDAEEA